MTPSLGLAAPAARPDLVAVLDELLAPVAAAACPEPGVDPEIWDRVLVGFARDLLARPGKQLRARVVELAFELAGGGAGLPAVILKTSPTFAPLGRTDPSTSATIPASHAGTTWPLSIG